MSLERMTQQRCRARETAICPRLQASRTGLTHFNASALVFLPGPLCLKLQAPASLRARYPTESARLVQQRLSSLHQTCSFAVIPKSQRYKTMARWCSSPATASSAKSRTSTSELHSANTPVALLRPVRKQPRLVSNEHLASLERISTLHCTSTPTQTPSFRHATSPHRQFSAGATATPRLNFPRQHTSQWYATRTRPHMHPAAASTATLLDAPRACLSGARVIFFTVPPHLSPRHVRSVFHS
jgi:hypothetical protein